jgi:hypothetical protein
LVTPSPSTTTVNSIPIFFSLKMWFDVTLSRWGDQLKWTGFECHHRETDRFFCIFRSSDRGQFHFRHSAFSSHLKSRVDLVVLTKTSVLRITLNLDGEPITSKSHTHPSHSQTSRLLTSSLSLGVPVPPATQCMWTV